MKRGGWIAALGLLGACGDFGDGRVARLEQELTALRAAQAQAPPDVAAAMAPLRGAIDLLVQRGEVERTRWTAVTAELDQLAALMHGFVDESRRAQVETLRGRVGELDRQIKEQAKTQGEERELLLKALEMTATKLEAFLRQVSTQKVERPPAAGEAPVRRSWQDPAVLWPLGLCAVGVAALLLVARRPRRLPHAVPLDLPVGPDAVVDAPEPVPGVGAAAEPAHGPVPLRVEVGGGDVGAARDRVTRWLAGETRVLKLPAPEIELRGPVLHVRFFVPDGMPAAERASLVADVRLGS